MREVKPLTEDTLKDARVVISERFPHSALDVLTKTMENPLRKTEPEVGDIVYEDGRPVAFRAANRRKLFFGNRIIYGRVRGLTCRSRTSSKDVMDTLVKAQISNLRSCAIAYSNTQCRPTEKIALKYGAVPGPESCKAFRWRAVRPIACVAYFLRRKLFKADIPSWQNFSTLESLSYRKSYGEIDICRVDLSDLSLVDEFMRNYLQNNQGLVSSRSAEEYTWLWKDQIIDGRCVVLCTMRHNAPVGIVVLTSDAKARRWTLVDLIALKNEKSILSCLLKGACEFLRRHTPCIMLETIGFPEYAQSLMKKHLPFSRKQDANWFSYNFLDPEISKDGRCLIKSEKSWFFGPYDGDMCMG